MGVFVVDKGSLPTACATAGFLQGRSPLAWHCHDVTRGEGIMDIGYARAQ